MPEEWKITSVTPDFQKCKKADSGNYRIMFVPEKTMKQILLEDVLWHMQNKVIQDSQHGFTKGRLCLTNLVAFCDAVMALVDKGKATDFIYPNC